MNAELFSAIIGAALSVWAGYAALSATRSPSRMRMLGKLLSGLTFILIVRLVTPFGGWGDWWVWVWIVALLAVVAAVFRTADIWADRPWQAEERSARRIEALGVGVEVVLALVVAGALVIPGMLL